MSWGSLESRQGMHRTSFHWRTAFLELKLEVFQTFIGQEKIEIQVQVMVAAMEKGVTWETKENMMSNPQKAEVREPQREVNLVTLEERL